MKGLYKLYVCLAICFGIFTITGCEDLLDKEYDASLSEEKVFNNTTLTKQYLANLYTLLPDGLGHFSDGQYKNASRDCMTDNASSFWGLIYYNKIRTDSYTSSSHPLIDGFWDNNFDGIRRANIFLQNLRSDVISDDATSGDDSHLYTRYKAEARLLRALYHFELAAYFGGAPILEDKILSTDMDYATDFVMEDAADVFKWVADECDSVRNVLPFRYSSEGSWGRVNGAYAYALKSRALLYRASALNNPDNNSEWWQDAADAAKEFIDKNAAISKPYSLYRYSGTPSSTSLPSSIVNAPQGALNYMYCFITEAYNNNEVIMGRSTYNTTVIDYSFLPFGSFSGAYGRTNPSQNLIDSYETINGEFIENDASYDEQDPYSNRDPRLGASIFHHGSVWGRPDYGEEATVDIHYNSADDQGADYRGAQGGTYSGYYVKKWVNPNIIFDAPTAQTHNWILFRYAEILLNYAEALNEASSDPNTAVYDAVNEVRDRAGMPALSGLTKAEMRERIRNERRVEFVFEDQRFFDVRRWKLYYDQTASSEKSLPYRKQIYNLYGVKVTVEGSTPIYEYGKDSNVGDIVYSTPKNDVFPIPYTESVIIDYQNTGW